MAKLVDSAGDSGIPSLAAVLDPTQVREAAQSACSSRAVEGLPGAPASRASVGVSESVHVRDCVEPGERVARPDRQGVRRGPRRCLSSHARDLAGGVRFRARIRHSPTGRVPGSVASSLRVLELG